MGKQDFDPNMRNFAYGDRRTHMGITVRVRAGIAKNSHMESPRMHNEFVRIW